MPAFWDLASLVAKPFSFTATARSIPSSGRHSRPATAIGTAFSAR